ncbi:MAG TPA: hypothetical protein VGN19_08285 [Pedococcus sp.]|jgi:hypothetical protein|nr:hypothetical protein [Pedococcus sp.]
MRTLLSRPTAIAALMLVLTSTTACASMVGVHDVPTPATAGAPLSALQAEQIATRVLTQASAASLATGTEAKTLRAASLTGSALTVANAADQLGPTVPNPNPVTRTAQPRVLAISRGPSWPRVILVQTSDANGSTILNLLTSADPQTAFRLSARATMQGGATIPALDALTDGSPLTVDSAKLAVDPAHLASEYAASVGFPTATAAADVSTTDPFSTGVRANAAAQAKSFGDLATLTRQHKPHPEDLVTIGLRGGGALVFALLERTDDITLKSAGKSLTPSAAFQKLVGKKTLTQSAELKSYETVVFTLPAKGQASVVAVDETLVSAKGA